MPATPAPNTPAPKKMGFLSRLFASVFGSNDPEWQRERALHLLEKDLKRIRPRFYNPSQRLLEPAFARFLHELYRTFAPAQAVLRGAEASAALRLITVELALTEEQQQLRERLSDQSLTDRAKTVEAGVLAEQVRGELARFTQGFDAETIKTVDARYNNLAALLDLVTYDYWVFLRKFDLAYPEHDLVYKPAFKAIGVEGGLDELKDLLEVVPVIDPQADWDPVLDVLKEYKGVDIITRDGMRRVLQLLREVQRTGVLLGIVRHASGNPGYRATARHHRERIVEPFLSKHRSQVELVLQKLSQARANAAHRRAGPPDLLRRTPFRRSSTTARRRTRCSRGASSAGTCTPHRSPTCGPSCATACGTSCATSSISSSSRASGLPCSPRSRCPRRSTSC